MLLAKGLIYTYRNIIKPSLIYSSAAESIENQEYDNAIKQLSLIPQYKDSKEKTYFCYKALAESYYADKDYENTSKALKNAQRYTQSDLEKNEVLYFLATCSYETGDYVEADKIFSELTNYKDSSELSFECKYQIAKQYMFDGEYDMAFHAFLPIKEYKDSDILRTISEQLNSWITRSTIGSVINNRREVIEQYYPLFDLIDDEELAKSCKYNLAVTIEKTHYNVKARSYEYAIELLTKTYKSMIDYNDCAERLKHVNEVFN